MVTIIEDDIRHSHYSLNLSALGKMTNFCKWLKAKRHGKTTQNSLMTNVPIVIQYSQVGRNGC
ncbi:hypothetical protein DERP_007690 [Dermatophagoides pteronyssinus]|uniref:Uncharacterized protein n=1 Tax=Dermatophagoides pteronyssinus TaxID=6956 RepID=A0ABQ8JKG0_DERPT|nr:hypothetical protein DERP_007690 [Dermatophagoides pteronyssinus]